MIAGSAVRDHIIARTAELADVTVDQITDETSLESLGLDSSDAVIMAMEVEELAGREIDIGIFLQFPTVREAADEIAKLVERGT